MDAVGFSPAFSIMEVAEDFSLVIIEELYLLLLVVSTAVAVTSSNIEKDNGVVETIPLELLTSSACEVVVDVERISFNAPYSDALDVLTPKVSLNGVEIVEPSELGVLLVVLSLSCVELTAMLTSTVCDVSVLMLKNSKFEVNASIFDL
jgi:hypothetical protein